MSTIRNKALLAIQSKAAIRAIIIDKGVDVGADVPLSQYANKLNLIKEVNIQVIASLTEPATPKPGMIWVKATSNINNYIFADNINPDVVQDFDNNTVYLYSSTTSSGFEPQNILLYDFGGGIEIHRTIACSVVIGNDMQLLYEVYVYNVQTLSFEHIATLKLPLILKDYINIEQFLGAGLTPPSLFNVLGMAEEVDLEAYIESASEVLDLEQFLGAGLTPTSLFNILGMIENVQIMKGGEQIYP